MRLYREDFISYNHFRETLDSQDQQGVMVSRVGQDYRVHQDRLESRVRMELKEIWEHLAKRASRARKDLLDPQDHQVSPRFCKYSLSNLYFKYNKDNDVITHYTETISRV